MASTWARREDLEAGDLPQVCVTTGAPADGTVVVRFDPTPSWTWTLLLFGIFPFLIATMFAKEHVRGEVPVLRDTVERYHRRRRTGWGLVVLGVATVVGGRMATLYGSPRSVPPSSPAGSHCSPPAHSASSTGVRTGQDTGCGSAGHIRTSSPRWRPADRRADPERNSPPVRFAWRQDASGASPGTAPSSRTPDASMAATSSGRSHRWTTMTKTPAVATTVANRKPSP